MKPDAPGEAGLRLAGSDAPGRQKRHSETDRQTGPLAGRKRVAVVGAGVIGLTTALVTAQAGHDVTVYAASRPEDTVSAVAAAIWAPFHARPAALIDEWAEHSFGIFASLSDSSPEAGVRMMEGIVVVRKGAEPLPWPGSVKGNRPALPEELPSGADEGIVCAVPVASMNTYLPWLVDQCGQADVSWHWSAISALDELQGHDVVVLATGLNSLGLHADDGLYPIRGQIARLESSSPQRWTLDDANPAGSTYIIPRNNEIICGGTADVGSFDLSHDAATENRILSSVKTLEPALRSATYLGARVGLRPGRDEARLEVVECDGLSVIHSYGHGGSGVTVSWGVARSSLELIEGIG